MKKKTLNLEKLRVDSFVTDTAGLKGGTIGMITRSTPCPDSLLMCMSVFTCQSIQVACPTMPGSCGIGPM